MKFSTLAAIIPFLSLSALAQGNGRHWNAGVEYFSWQEYVTTCPQVLREWGPRAFVRYDDARQYGNGWQLGWQGKLYAGRISYDGYTQSCVPLYGSTDYFGGSGEASAIRWLSTPATGSWPAFGIDTAVGIDAWRRSLLAPGGYSEDYGIAYVRLGVAAQRGRDWSVRVGIKDPFSSNEIARLGAAGFSSDVTLHPKGVLSYFADLEYRLSSGSDITFYYDSYRFDASDAVTVASCPPANKSCSVHQPQSAQDTVGVSWRLHL